MSSLDLYGYKLQMFTVIAIRGVIFRAALS